MIAANRPPVWSKDHVSGTIRKGLKRIAGARASQATLLAAAEWLERLRAPAPILWPLYRAAIAGSMYGGYQEGLRRRVGPSRSGA